MYAVVLHPNIELKTSDSRAVLPEYVPLKDAITQTGNLGGFIAGLFTQDYELVGRSLKDVLIEPARKHLIPYFDVVKKTAIDNGALGAGISGAGPSIFALCKGEANAKIVANAMQMAFQDSQLSFDIHLSLINAEGTKII